MITGQYTGLRGHHVSSDLYNTIQRFVEMNNYFIKYAVRVLDWTYTLFCSVWLVYLSWFILTYSGSNDDPNRPPIEASIMALVLSTTMLPILIVNWKTLQKKEHNLSTNYRVALTMKFWGSASITVPSFCIAVLFTILDIDYYI